MSMKNFTFFNTSTFVPDLVPR